MDGFNPTRVRLKQILMQRLRTGNYRLQPHKGSSETTLPTDRTHGLQGFNPTRVRLKPAHVRGTLGNGDASTPQGFV